MSNLKVYAKTIEDEALEQINTLLSQDAFKDCKVRIMPDVHAGKGCVIGFTADLGNKVIPNIVGVDIGCGMLCVSLGHRDFNAVTLNTLDRVIRTYVPSGKNVHDGRQMRFEELKELYCYRELKDTKRLERSIGTLGGGNHFIEVDVAEDGYKYLIIHTGSRNLGKQVADYYQNLAYEVDGAVRMICMIVRKSSLLTTKLLEENLRLNPQSRSCAETSVLSLRNCRKTSVI